MIHAQKFKDPTPLAIAIFVALLVDILASLTSAAVEIEAIQFIERVEADGFASFREGRSAAAALEDRETVVAAFNLASIVAAGALILVWIRRMNRNARALGALDLHFSPNWAIGWYFVPIANLWKPYQAMTEIWRASASPATWQETPVPALLPVWWTLWLAVNLASQASSRLLDRGETFDYLRAAYVVGGIADLASVALDGVFIVLVARLTRIQLSSWEEAGTIRSAV